MSNYAPVGQTKQEYQRAYYRRNRHMFLDAQLKLAYGITRETYNKLLADQAGKCKLCNEPGVRNGKRAGKLYVDHIKQGDKKIIRGLLCHKCNCALGMLGDNEEGLARALAYVRGE